MADSKAFLDELRHALDNLHVPEQLRKSPLIDRFGFGYSDDEAALLRQILESAIEAFRPATGSIACERAQRHFEVLRGRYLESLNQQAVGNRLGITPRHVRREQEAALYALAQYLEMQFDLGVEGERSQPAQQSRGENSEYTERKIEVNREMLWLANSLQNEISEVEPVICEVGELIQSLAQQHASCVHIACDDHLPSVSIARIVLRQVVLNLITAAVQNLGNGSRVRLETRATHDHVVITIMAKGSQARSWHSLEPLSKAADTSGQLTELFSGRFVLSEMEGWLIAKVHLPCVCQKITILAIEDNVDTLRLWRRYVQETSFGLIGETDPQSALAKAINVQPSMIVLDVMMPGIDGWELLRQLKEHPVTTGIPVVVCTVLPQRDFAISLGASDFIQKPTTGREFRAVLERQSAVGARSG